MSGAGTNSSTKGGHKEATQKPIYFNMYTTVVQYCPCARHS